MNIKNIILSSMLLGLTLVNTQVLAQQDDGMQMMPSTMGKFMMMDFSDCPQYMQLNESQKIEVKKNMDDFKNKMTSLQKDLMDKMMLLKEQMLQSNLDENQINKTTKELSSLHDQILTEYTSTMERMKKTTGFMPIECDKEMSKMLPQQDYLHSTLPSNSQHGLQTSSDQGLQSSSSQGLQTGPNATNQMQTPMPSASSPCQNGSADDKGCLMPAPDNRD